MGQPHVVEDDCVVPQQLFVTFAAVVELTLDHIINGSNLALFRMLFAVMLQGGHPAVEDELRAKII